MITEVLYYTFIYPMQTLLGAVFEWLYAITHSYGLAIVLLSLCVNVFLLKLTHLSESKARAVSALKSACDKKIAEFKKVFRGAELHAYTQILFKQKHYHPIYNLFSLSGLALQIPFFLGVLFLLQDFEGLQGARFGVIEDLSKPDTLLFGYALLPFVMSVLSLINVFVSSKERGARVQGSLIALIFLVLLYVMPSGLVVYWSVSMGFSLLRTLLGLRHSAFLKKLRFGDKSLILRSGFGHYRLGSSLHPSLENNDFSSKILECQDGKPSVECKASSESSVGLESSPTDSKDSQKQSIESSLTDSESKIITQSTTSKTLNEALPNINNNGRSSASRAESNFAKSHTNSEFAHKEQHEILGFEMRNRGFGARSEEATLAVVPEAERVDSLMRDQRGQISEGKSTQKTSQGKAQGLGGSILDEKSGLCSRERGDKTRASIDEVSDKLPDLSLKDNAPQSMPTILISPSWGKETLLTKYGLTLLEPLAQAGFSLIIRPHPQSLIGEAESKNIAHLQEALQQYANVAWDIGTPNVYAFAKADMMISDFSSVIFDFVCLEGKPVLTLDFAFDPAGYDLSDIDMEHFYTFETLKRIGGKLEERDFAHITSVIAQILESNKTKEAQKCKEELWRYPHHAGLKAAQEILKIERELLEQNLKAYMPQVRRIREIDAMLEGVR